MAGDKKLLLKPARRDIRLTPKDSAYLEDTVKKLKEKGIKDITVTKLLTEGGIKEADRLRLIYGL